jgi:hypothetical protein
MNRPHSSFIVVLGLALSSQPAQAEECLFNGMNYEKNANYIVIPSKTESIPGSFILDTGSTYLTIDNRYLGQFAKMESESESESVSTLKGKIKADNYLSPPINLGAWSLAKDQHAINADFTLFTQVCGFDVCGFVGMSSVRSNIVMVNFDSDTLTICDAIPESIQIGKYASVKMTIAEGSLLPYITIGIGTVNLIVGIDTGAGVSLTLTPEFFDRFVNDGLIKLHKNIVYGVTGGGMITKSSGSISGVSCASSSYPAIEVHSMKDASPDIISHIGMNFLSRNNIIFDFAHGRLYLLPRKSLFDRPDHEDDSGLHILRINGRVVAAKVDGGSPSDRAGFVIGDYIAKINGSDIGTLNLFEARKMISNFTAAPVRFDLQDHASGKTYVVNLSK